MGKGEPAGYLASDNLERILVAAESLYRNGE
jgi:hypothetical protein